jgi:hypothetical protein
VPLPLGLFGPSASLGAEYRPASLRKSHRHIPIGVSGVQNQVFRSSRYVYAIRFVVDRRTRVWRFQSGFRLDGTDRVGGSAGYADGSGGRIRARLVRVDKKGRPDLSRVLASETVGAVDRYLESVALTGTRTMMLHFNMGGVRLKPGRMYAMTYQNVSRHPVQDWFSTNSPVVKASEAGPNGRNTLDPRTPGAIAGLDPREALAWSTNGGRKWVWGRRVGEGFMRGSYPGSRTDDGGVRLPWYGWQPKRTGRARSNQPYYAYKASGRYTLTLANAPRAVRLTEAGGYAPVGASVGTVTVRNLRTQEEGRTEYLGRGIAVGRLSPPVRVKRGDSYSITNSGTVFKAEGDVFIARSFGVGNLGGRFPFVTEDYGSDRAELFALPHPFFRPLRRH